MDKDREIKANVKNIHRTSIACFKIGNRPVTAMLESQLKETHVEIAIEVKFQDGGNISGVISQGSGPRPIEKKITNNKRHIPGRK
jgi:hypothetical protein